MERLQVLVPKFFIRSVSNAGEMAKTYFQVTGTESIPPTLISSCRILTKDADSLIECGFTVLKSYKDWYLCERWFGIKMETYSILTNKLIDSGIISTRHKP